ncbi:hypothetical protein A7P53_08875 [Acinetobacter defluvii]|uniref:hypothetical protein n=1 Tax=Acinetobacter defluvii TaxID=1871111 RepID=UPI00148F965A|nr:hypothetical protein [Acinetobacter defluvii]NNP72679.1 hypothetical protein [Acinetobacter defluvii]
MDLFEDIEIENNKFINVVEALELAARKISYGVSDIARRLLLDEFNKTAFMFKLNDYEKIELYCSEQELNGDYGVTTEFLKLTISTGGTLEYVETDIYGNKYEYVKDHWLKYYWLKSDFFNFPSIKKMDISEEDYKNFLEANNQECLYDFMAQLTKLEDDKEAKEKAKNVSINFFQEVAEFELNQELGGNRVENSNNQSSIIDQLKIENETLKALLLKKDEEIDQLEQKLKFAESLKYLENTQEILQRESKISEQEENIKKLSLCNEQFSNEIHFLKKRLMGISRLENHFEEQEMLTPYQEIPSSKTRNKVSILIAVLCELNKMDITQPLGEPNILILDQASKLKAPLGKDFVGNWLKLARENIE